MDEPRAGLGSRRGGLARARFTTCALAAGVLLLQAVAAPPADAPPAPGPAAQEARARRLLLEAALRGDAPPDRADRSGWTPLHEAAASGDATAVRALVRRGARPDLRARALGTPLDVAESAGRLEIARLLRTAGARGSGKSIGDGVCVRPWAGQGYCAVVASRDATRFELRVTTLVGCAGGCAPEPACSAGRVVGAFGLAPGDALTVPASCLTDTGVR